MKNKLLVVFSMCFVLLGASPVFSEEKQTTIYPKVQVVTSVGDEVKIPDTIKTLDDEGKLVANSVSWGTVDSSILSTVGS